MGVGFVTEISWSHWSDLRARTRTGSSLPVSGLGVLCVSTLREAHSAWVLDLHGPAFGPRRGDAGHHVFPASAAKFWLHMHRVKRQTGAQRVNLRWQGARRFEAHRLVRALNGEQSWRRRVYAQLPLHEVQLLLEGRGRWRLLAAAFWA